MTTTAAPCEPVETPRMADCPPHAPIPIQGGGGMVCAKCGAKC